MTQRADLMTRNEIKELLRLKDTGFWKLTKSGKFPPPKVNISRKSQLWSKADVISYIEGTWEKSQS